MREMIAFFENRDYLNDLSIRDIQTAVKDQKFKIESSERKIKKLEQSLQDNDAIHKRLESLETKEGVFEEKIDQKIFDIKELIIVHKDYVESRMGEIRKIESRTHRQDKEISKQQSLSIQYRDQSIADNKETNSKIMHLDLKIEDELKALRKKMDQQHYWLNKHSDDLSTMNLQIGMVGDKLVQVKDLQDIDIDRRIKYEDFKKAITELNDFMMTRFKEFEEAQTIIKDCFTFSKHYQPLMTQMMINQNLGTSLTQHLNGGKVDEEKLIQYQQDQIQSLVLKLERAKESIRKNAPEKIQLSHHYQYLEQRQEDLKFVKSRNESLDFIQQIVKQNMEQIKNTLVQSLLQQTDVYSAAEVFRADQNVQFTKLISQAEWKLEKNQGKSHDQMKEYQAKKRIELEQKVISRLITSKLEPDLEHLERPRSALKLDALQKKEFKHDIITAQAKMMKVFGNSSRSFLNNDQSKLSQLSMHDTKVQSRSALHAKTSIPDIPAPNMQSRRYKKKGKKLLRTNSIQGGIKEELERISGERQIEEKDLNQVVQYRQALKIWQEKGFSREQMKMMKEQLLLQQSSQEVYNLMDLFNNSDPKDQLPIFGNQKTGKIKIQDEELDQSQHQLYQLKHQQLLDVNNKLMQLANSQDFQSVESLQVAQQAIQLEALQKQMIIDISHDSYNDQNYQEQLLNDEIHGQSSQFNGIPSRKTSNLIQRKETSSFFGVRQQASQREMQLVGMTNSQRRTLVLELKDEILNIISPNTENQIQEALLDMRNQIRKIDLQLSTFSTTINNRFTHDLAECRTLFEKNLFQAKDEFHQDLKSLRKQIARDKSDYQLKLKDIAESTETYQDQLNFHASSLEMMAQSIALLTENVNIQIKSEERDVEDKKKMALLGSKESKLNKLDLYGPSLDKQRVDCSQNDIFEQPSVSRAPQFNRSTSSDYRQSPDAQQIQIDQACLSCQSSGTDTQQILQMFKVACISYAPSVVCYRDKFFSRLDLLKYRSLMIDRVGSLIYNSPLFKQKAIYPKRYFDDLILEDSLMLSTRRSKHDDLQKTIKQLSFGIGPKTRLNQTTTFAADFLVGTQTSFNKHANEGEAINDSEVTSTKPLDQKYSSYAGKSRGQPQLDMVNSSAFNSHNQSLEHPTETMKAKKKQLNTTTFTTKKHSSRGGAFPAIFPSSNERGIKTLDYDTPIIKQQTAIKRKFKFESSQESQRNQDDITLDKMLNNPNSSIREHSRNYHNRIKSNNQGKTGVEAGILHQTEVQLIKQVRPMVTTTTGLQDLPRIHQINK